jgi:carboxyl-terminal processing protease
MNKKNWLACIFFGLAAGMFSHAEDAPATPPVAQNALPIDDLRLFSEVFHQIRTNYVSEVTDQQLLEYAIKGMLGSLDPHSAYLNKNDFAELQDITAGEFGGIGIEIIMENGFMKVVSPLDDTPAQLGGIRAGDIILKINNKVIKGLSMDEGIEMMRGEKGSEISLTIMHANETTPVELKLIRDIIKIQSVKSRILEKHWGYLRISQFQARTATDAKDHLNKMLEKTSRQMQGLIIDLRNNPGGLLNAAIEISDLFLKDGLIVYTKGRIPESQESYRAKPDVMLEGKPIIILINSGSASASEIVAGALQDHKRAVIAGTTSFGKGSVQVILELPNNRGMKLTTARYYTPLGRSIQAEGIKPDITIQNAELRLHNDDTTLVKEADLSGHLENKDVKAESDKKSDDPLIADYQLYEALNLLKAMSLAQSSVK